MLLDAVRRQQLTLISSSEQLAEIQDVASRPHLQKYLKPGILEAFLRFIDGAVVLTDEPLPTVTESPDPKDNMILATALAGRAEIIVSGDKRHLLVLGDFRGISIVTAAAAVEIVSKMHDRD